MQICPKHVSKCATRNGISIRWLIKEKRRANRRRIKQELNQARLDYEDFDLIDLHYNEVVYLFDADVYY